MLRTRGGRRSRTDDAHFDDCTFVGSFYIDIGAYRAAILKHWREVAAEHFGPIYIDDHMRNIPDHYHAHGRPEGGFFGRDFARRPSRSA